MLLILCGYKQLKLYFPEASNRCFKQLFKAKNIQDPILSFAVLRGNPFPSVLFVVQLETMDC